MEDILNATSVVRWFNPSGNPDKPDGFLINVENGEQTPIKVGGLSDETVLQFERDAVFTHDAVSDPHGKKKTSRVGANYSLLRKEDGLAEALEKKFNIEAKNDKTTKVEKVATSDKSAAEIKTLARPEFSIVSLMPESDGVIAVHGSDYHFKISCLDLNGEMKEGSVIVQSSLKVSFKDLATGELIVGNGKRCELKIPSTGFLLLIESKAVGDVHVTFVHAFDKPVSKTLRFK